MGVRTIFDIYYIYKIVLTFRIYAYYIHMVKQRVAESHTSAWDREIGRALGKLERVALHKIHDTREISALCHEIISRVDGVADLVHITPDRLEELTQAVGKKVKRLLASSAMVEISDVDVNEQSAKIRHDWNSENWKEGAPHGWAWREQVRWHKKQGKREKEVIALVYEVADGEGIHEIFLDREILAHPRGAIALIENMRKRHTSLMKWDKKHK